MGRASLGVVVGGTFNKGLQVRLSETTSSEQLQIGDFCVVQGDSKTYFGIIQDLALQTTDAGLMSVPPTLSPFMAEILRGTATYATAEVQPLLMVDPTLENGGVQPVRTIPMHFASLVRAAAPDFRLVFGMDDGRGSHFNVGQPLTMDVGIPLDLEKLVQRSSGVFGSTGTGKSFLTRLLLCGIIQRNVAVNLVFDMHNEYAYGVHAEGAGQVKGLKELFGSKIVVYSLDEKNHRADHHLKISLDEISTEDVLLLARELRVSASTVETNLALLRRLLGETWLRKFIDMDAAQLEEFAKGSNAHVGSLQALYNRLHRLKDRGYISSSTSHYVFSQMMDYLSSGKHVILHFGRHDDILDQMIVANMVTRRIRALYQEKTEKWQQSRAAGDKPIPLVITVEEAHRFLNPEIARNTIFGTIARELRKYFVTLLIVDQRPSGIDDEILSQIGTRISGKLLDERDIEAVLSGVSSRNAIRAGIASLDTKQQCMIFGHAVPMPIALRSRTYDNTFFAEMMSGGKGVRSKGPGETAILPQSVEQAELGLPDPKAPMAAFEESLDRFFEKD